MTFHGVRGSTACHGEETARYGGNTSCVSVDAPDQPLILFDLGTGSRYASVAAGREVICLVTHLHWDHIQGLPFFPPMLDEASGITVCAPSPLDGGSLDETMASIIRAPMFPVGLDAFPARPGFMGLDGGSMVINGVSVSSVGVSHVGKTLGYRVDVCGFSVAYVSDHQQPMDGSGPDPKVLDLCRGVDLLIHDSQYTAAELASRPDWGHCTPEFALEVARASGAQHLVMFHHDPDRTDRQLDDLVEAHRDSAEPRVTVAREGASIALGVN